MFEPLLRYLPKYFNTDPEKREAIRLRAPAGTTATWDLHDERLSLAWADQTQDYDLRDYTVGAIVDDLQAQGFILDPGYDHLLLALGAVVLLEGRGTLVDFAGSPFYAFTSLLHALTRPVESGWRQFQDAIPEAVDQESIATADADWLTVHGDLYGIPRLAGMDDATYRAHLIAEVFRPRNTPRGIEHSLRRLGYPAVRVREPWQEMHYLSTDATLSGGHHLPGAPIYEYHTMQLFARSLQSWAGPMAQAGADRPAGTVLLPPATLLPPTVLTTPVSGLFIASSVLTGYAAALYYNRHGILSLDLMLSDMTGQAALPLARIDVRAVATLGVRGPYVSGGATGFWSASNWNEETWQAGAMTPNEITPPITIGLPSGYADLLAAIAVQQAAVMATQAELDADFSALPEYAALYADLASQFNNLVAADSLLNRDETVYATVQAQLVNYAADLLATQAAMVALL